MNTNRVWCDPIARPQNVNLNQTAIYSENPLKSISGNKSTLEPLDSSTDFLLSENLNNIFNITKTLDGHYKHDLLDCKRLAPRYGESPVTSSTHQPSDQVIQTIYKTAGPQEVVPLKNFSHISADTEYTELKPSDKDNQPIYIAEPIQTGNQYGFCDLGIDIREETVVSEVNIIEEPKIEPQQYTPGEVIYGGKQALEKLARDTSKLKTGEHGVITNPKYEFLWNPKTPLKKKKVLGRGGNGTVELYSYKDVEFVTKTIFRDFRSNEVLFTNTLSHEFIVKSHGLIIRNGSPQIIMDYAGDNLLHYGLSRVVDESEIWNINYQILEALNYLHSKQIRHFDVKPENIVLLQDHDGHKTLKLADFGGATLFTEEVDCLSWTPAYMSPEMDQFYLKRQFPRQQLITSSCGPITEKCDIYSLALSVLFLYVRGHILIKHVTKGMQAMVGQEKADAVSMKIVILNAQKPDLGESLIPASVGKEMKTVLSGMLKGKVEDRLTAKHAMDLMQELSSHGGHTPKRIMRRKSKSVENRQNCGQTIKTKKPKLVIVTLDPTGKKVAEYQNPFAPKEEPKRIFVGKEILHYDNTLETEEHQRPLRDLSEDLQLRMILDQSENVKDEKMKQVIEEENRPLLTRLVKRKLKGKLSEEIAFKMTKMREELDSSSSTSTSSGKENVASVNLSGQGNIVTSPSEPEVMQMDVPGNIPNFDMFLEL